MGALRNLYDAPAPEFIVDFISKANLIPCDMERVEVGTATIRVGALRHPVPARGVTACPAKLAVRADAIALTPGEEPLRRRVQSSAYLADHVAYGVATPIGQLYAINSDAQLNVGTVVALAFRSRGLAVIQEGIG